MTEKNDADVVNQGDEDDGDDTMLVSEVDLLASGAVGSLETAKTTMTWLAAHIDTMPPDRALDSVARSISFTALALNQLQQLGAAIHEGGDLEDDEDDEADTDDPGCGHPTCRGEEECIEADDDGGGE